MQREQIIISIASGKGGTGKTSIAVNLALSLSDVQVLDCDVEEPNLHIFLNPVIKENIIATTMIPSVDMALCNTCGKCKDICSFNAIVILPQQNEKKGKVLIFPQLCHNCEACTILCPQNAITEIEHPIGKIDIGENENISFVQGILNINEISVPELISQVKKKINSKKTIIIDAPPGTSCSMISAVSNSNFCILVTEQTLFGLNDLILSVETVKRLNIPFGVIINRYSLEDDCISSYCERENIPILMKIDYQKRIAELYAKGVPFVKEMQEYKDKFNELLVKIREIIYARNINN